MNESPLVLTAPELTRLLYRLDACPEAHEWVYRNPHLNSLDLYAQAGAGWIIWFGAMFGRPEALGVVCELAVRWLTAQPQADVEIVAALQLVGVVVRWRRGEESQESLRAALTAVNEGWLHPDHGGSAARHLARCVVQAAWAIDQDEPEASASWADDAVKAMRYGAPLDAQVATDLARRHLPYDVLAACVRPIWTAIRGG
ncbi:MAG TPA: hypothetical protein VFS21_02540 [Roseiflexaceae bacterium]|nr:hypothetical protein [Roseiflexaceae bacterium]